MSIHSDSANRALPTGADAVNVSVSEGGQQKTVERAGDAQTNSSTGRTTVSYNVKMKMDNGTERSFKITVGFTRDQLEAHLKGELEEGGGQLEDTIDKIVNGMKAEDIMKAAGQRISARLDDLDNATVAKLHGGGQPRQLSQLIESSDESERTMANSISKVINAFSKSEVGKLFSSNVNPQTSSSGTNSPPQGTGTRNQDVDQVAALESRLDQLGGGEAPADLDTFIDQLTDELREENSTGGTVERQNKTDSSTGVDDLDALLADLGNGGEKTVQPQGQEEAHVDGSNAPNPGESDRLTPSKEARTPSFSTSNLETYAEEKGLPSLPSTPVGSSVEQHRDRSASADSVTSRSDRTAGWQTKKPSEEARNSSGSTDRANKPLARGRSASEGTLSRLPESLADKRSRVLNEQFRAMTPPPELKLRHELDSVKNKGAPESQIETDSGIVTGEDVTELGQGSGNPTVHSVMTGLQFDVEETTPQTTSTRRPSIEETKPTEKKEQQSTENELTSKKQKLTNLHTRLIKGQSKIAIKNKTRIKPKQYQEAVSDILDLGDAHIIELKYEVPIPLKKGQKLNKGEKPKTQTATVETTQLLKTFLGKKAGQKAILEDSSTYDRLTKNSLEHIREYSPELAKTIENMQSPEGKKEKLERLNLLLQAREMSTRYETVEDQLPVTKEQQSTENELSSKKEKLTNLHTRLIKGQSKKWIKKKTGITQKQYQEAVSDIIDLGNANIIELKYEVPIPLKKGQTLAEGEKPKTKPVTVGTTQLLGKFLQKSNGRKAIIKNNEIYEKLKNDSLQHIKQFAPELAVKLEKMPQKNEKQKVEFLKSLLEAREISTRYKLVAAKLPVTAEGLKPVDTSSIALNYTHPKYADENAQDLVQDLDSQISSLTQQLQDNENKSETMDKIGDCLCRKELIAQKGDFVKAKAALTQQLSKAEDSANQEQAEKLKSALSALPKVMNEDVKQFRMLSNTLKEVFDSEYTYCDGLVALTEKSYGSEDNKMTFYQLLHHDGLINDVELEILQSHTEDCLKESARFICELAGLPYNEDVSSSANISDAKKKFHGLSTEDQLGKVLNGFRPERFNQAVKPMTAMILKQSQTTKIISSVAENKNGKERLDEFSQVPSNKGLQLSAFVATPFQRALKYPSFHDNLAKFAPSSASDQIAINMQQLRNNFEIVNSIAPRT